MLELLSTCAESVALPACLAVVATLLRRKISLTLPKYVLHVVYICAITRCSTRTTGLFARHQHHFVVPNGVGYERLMVAATPRDKLLCAFRIPSGGSRQKICLYFIPFGVLQRFGMFRFQRRADQFSVVCRRRRRRCCRRPQSLLQRDGRRRRPHPQGAGRMRSRHRFWGDRDAQGGLLV